MKKRLMTPEQFAEWQKQAKTRTKQPKTQNPVEIAAKRVKSASTQAAGPLPTEAQEQKAVIDWFERFAPTVGLSDKLLMASANGAVLGGDARVRAIRSSQLKRQGMRTGTPDLFLAVSRGPFNGMLLEMKRQKVGKVSPEQAEMIYLLRQQGFNVVVCEGAARGIQAITVYLSQEGGDRHG